MKRTNPKKLTVLACAIGIGALAHQSRAGTVTYDFTTDPTQLTTNPIQVYQSGFADSSGTSIYWKNAGGNPGGFLALTWPIGSSSSIIVFPDIDAGKIVTAFKLETDLRIGSPQQNVRPADGFSINFARKNDPVFENHSANDFATGGAVETGTQTGLAISFDTWAGNTLPDGGDIEGIIVRVDNKTILRQDMPTRNGACDDNTSLQTGPRPDAFWDDPVTGAKALGTLPDIAFDQASWTNLCWAHLTVELNDQSKLSVTYKGRKILDQYQTTFFPSAGGIVLAGRTGNADEHTHFDNLTLTTTASTADTEKPTNPANLKATVVGAYRVVLTWDASTDNSGRVGYEIEQNGTILNGAYVDPTAELRNLKAKTAYTFRVRATDVSENKSDFASVSVTTAADVDDPNYAAIKVYGTTENPINGTPVQGLLDDARYPDAPDRVERLNGMILSFGEPNFGDTYGENYGSRLAGTVTPAITGQYRFFVRSDDASQLYLNTTAAAIPVADATSQIAEETGCCNAFTEPAVNHTDMLRTSDPISLTAGKAYGILFLQKEGGGGDWGQVAWRLEGDKTAASSLPPIGAGYFLAESTAKADPVGADVAITTPPKDATVAGNQPVAFNVVATFASPYTTSALYQWYKNGTAIPGANKDTYSIPFAAVADNAAKFKVVVAVPGKSATAEATLTVNADTVAPTIASPFEGQSSDTFDQVTVKYSEPVVAASAEAAANYGISGGVTVSAAKLQLLDPTTVVLTTSKLTEDTDYTLTVKSVADTANNPIAANTTAKFHSWKLVAKRVKGTFYTGIGGTAASDLTGAATFPGQPTTVRYFDKLEAGSENGNAGWNDSYGDNYGAILNAWLIPTETASYNFFIRSDDASQFFLGTDDKFPDPKTATPTAEETGCCKAFLEPGNATEASVTTASPISLTAGKKYGVTVLVKEGGGGDGVAVGWRKAGDTTAAGALPAISDAVWYYGPVAATTGGTLSISRSGGNLSVTFAGVIQSATSITGPWTDEAGPSPLSVTPSGTAKYYRNKP